MGFLPLILIAAAFSVSAAAASPKDAKELTPDQQARLVHADQLAGKMAALHRAGKTREAVPIAREIVEINRDIRGQKHADTALALNNLGLLLYLTGDYAAAKTQYEEALTIYREALGEDAPDLAPVLNNLGALHRATGDYAAARAPMEQALSIYRKTLGDKHPSVATALGNLGALFSAMGDLQAARSSYEEALAIRREALGPKHALTATALNNLAAILDAEGDRAAAKPLYDKILSLRRELLGNDHPDTAISLNNLGRLLTAAGDYDAARPLYEESLAIHRKSRGDKHPDTATALENLGALHSWTGERKTAREYFQEALAIREETLPPNHPDTALALDNLASNHAALGDLPLAARETDRSRRIVRRHIARVLPSLSQREQAMFLRQKDRDSLDAALSLGWAGRGAAEIVNQSAGWLFNGKAVAQEASAQRIFAARKNTSAEVTAWTKELSTVRRRLAAEGISNPTTEGRAARRERLSALERKEDELSRQIARASGHEFLAEPWVEMRQVRSAIPRDAIFVDIARVRLLDFASHSDTKKARPEHYLAWIVPPAGERPIQVIDLGEAGPIDAVVASLRMAIQSHAGADEDEPDSFEEFDEGEAEKQLRPLLTALSQQILAPLLAEIGDARRLILSPDGALWFVPWGALSLDDYRYLIERLEVQYAISARDLVRPRADLSLATAPLIFADPNYDLSVSSLPAVPTVDTSRRTRGGARLGRVSRLPGSAAEARRVQPLLANYSKQSPRLFLGNDAIEATFKASLRPRVLLLSTHGFILPEAEEKNGAGAEQAINPLLLCGLMLAGCNRRLSAAEGADDGVLTGAEIVGVDLRATELVVLSACETGLGALHNREGVSGLRQAFQLAGAESVAATLWKVPDEETAELMVEFFKHLAAGESKPAALRSAQLARIAARRSEHSAAHPFYWAAFTLTGE